MHVVAVSSHLYPCPRGPVRDALIARQVESNQRGAIGVQRWRACSKHISVRWKHPTSLRFGTCHSRIDRRPRDNNNVPTSILSITMVCGIEQQWEQGSEGVEVQTKQARHGSVTPRRMVRE